jgi:hypothetical protein
LAAFFFTFHLLEPNGILSVTVANRTYVGNPPALTLFERDPHLLVVVGVPTACVLVAATTELVLRTRRPTRFQGVGPAATVAGVLLVALSLLGWIVGVLGIGTIGVLVLLSGVRLKPATEGPQRPTPSERGGPSPLSAAGRDRCEIGRARSIPAPPPGAWP